ncbi:quercetin dioxygenase-like cupin family protein [Nocardia transvalensis]|uniref:Quercetin dioxygenase-like cupin family protein n=1 Tax=Nocardia transvalensis TaxID=37333 RepID=A0A7W9PCL8_9NOCA|nr:cupin domain-containing protein [Nocardia transvalensis]MBB5913154.1 quercetin dioxygenase-like cupin family protein [Nocardia transvalensis]
MRRIVVGGNGNGPGRVLADDTVDPLTLALLPGAELYRVWELDEPPALPVGTLPPRTETSYFPGPAGVRFGIISIPPGLTYEPDPEVSEEQMAAVVAEAEEKLPGMMAAFDPDAPGVHRTASVDFVVVLAGEGRLRLDDGVDVPLRQGDCVVQHGMPHAWFNDGEVPFVFSYTLCGVADGDGTGTS